MAIKHGETSITVEGATDANDEKFEQAMDFGGGRTMHTRTHDADADGNVVEEVAMVYTDIEAPVPTAFAMVEGQTLNARDLDDTVDADNDGTADNDFTALNVVTDNSGLIMSSGFSSSGSGTLNYANDDAGTTDMDEAFETAGTYNGASGTYRCNGTGQCSVTYDAMGMITGVAGDWVFTPDAGATSDVPDADYLHYGFWLKKTTDKDGVVTYGEVETFAGSSAARSDTGSVTGRATYSGGATGVYVHSVTNPDGTENSATSGHFTADANLTAHFGQTVDDTDTPMNEADRIAPYLLNSISGTINNFMLSDHDEGPGWSVSLEQAATDGTGTDPHVDNGVAKGGGDDGSYTATFHGPTTDDTQPHTVVGEFNAFFSNGSVAGGFGASKDD